MPPPQPNPPRLWGQTGPELEESRGVDRLRITWDGVAGATGYGLRVDGGVEAPAQPDMTVVGFAPVTIHSFEVRAHDATGPSPWSARFEMVTRPPTPSAPQQDAASPSLWGVALQWSEWGGFPGGHAAHVDVWRRLAGTELVIFPTQPLAGENLDESDAEMAPKAYWLRLVVPAAAIPSNPLPGDNSSFPGPELHASAPLVRRAVAPPLLARSSGELWRHHYGGKVSLV